jgi:hypothetical protein
MRVKNYASTNFDEISKMLQLDKVELKKFIPSVEIPDSRETIHVK